MAITNLSEYYASQGQSLPTVQDRQSTASQAGIQGYTGTAQQNATLLGYLQGAGNQAQGTTGIPSSGAVTIPSQVATGNVQPTQLPNQPTPSAPGDVYSSASAYLSSLPKTGVAGLDETLNASQTRPGELAKQYDVSNKLTVSNAAKAKLDTFNEQYRVEEERVRTNGALGAEIANARINELERKRAFTAGTYAIEAAAANADYQGALSLMNQQAALELEPLKMRYDFFKDRYNRTEDQRFQVAMKASDRAYQTARDEADTLNQFKLQALKDGKIAVGDLGNIKTLGDFATYGINPTSIVPLSTLSNGQPDVVDNLTNIIKVSGKDVPQASAAIGVLAGIQKLATNNPEGRFIGAAPGIGFGYLRGAESRGERIANQSDFDAINLKLQQWASGAALTAEQTKQVKNFAPDKNDTDFKIKEKLNNLTSFMQEQARAELAAKGINFTPLSVDYWKPSALQIEKATNTYLDSALSPNNAYSDYLNSLSQ